MIETRFSYEIKLNEQPLNVTLGVVAIKKLQEPLDEGALNIPVTVFDYEYKMLGLLTIKVIGDFTEKTFTYFIDNDEVVPLSKDGLYTHNLTLIEYTYLYDTKLIKALTFTQPLQAKRKAPFYVNYEGTLGFWNSAYRDYWIPPIDLLERYYTNETYVIPQCEQAHNNFLDTPFRRNVYIRLYSPNNVTFDIDQKVFVPIGGHYQEVILSTESLTMNLNKDGIWLLEYGIVDYNSPDTGIVSRMAIMTFILNFQDKQKYTLYDYVDRIKNVVPLETQRYHSETRLFNLEPSLVERFKQVEMPQIFITQMTLRQTLNTIFKFVNAIMRLEYVMDDYDTLTIDEFNKVIGSFELTQMVDFKTSQNIQGYGTKVVSWLENTLQANFRDNPTVKTPANNYFKTVRAKNVQLTETQGGFILPLDGGEIYELTKLTATIPRIEYGGTTLGNPNPMVVETLFEVDLTSRIIPLEEWDLKEITNDFPAYSVLAQWNKYVGMRPNKGGNIFWERGKNYIDFSKEFGTWFSDVLIIQTFKEAIAEHFTLNAPLSILADGTIDYATEVIVDNINENLFFRNIGFNVEYTTLKTTVVKNHRQDISVIDRDTEVRLNQSSRLIDFKLATRNAVGNIERMGIPNKDFTKIHTRLEDILEVAMQDDDGYVITQASYEFNNDYIVGHYEVTKDHIRLSEFMGIDRAYRAFTVPRDSQVYKRDEHYEDFIIIDRLNSTLEVQDVLYTQDFIFKAIKNLVAYDTTQDKVSFAFVRTDGFSSIYKDDTTYKAIMTPVSSYGGEQLLLFTFGFNSNILAGNSIYKRGGNYYNNPIRYTDLIGRFDELWFGMGDEYLDTTAFDDIAGSSETVFNKTYAYPLVQSNTPNMKQEFLIKTGDLFTATYNPLKVYKDPSEVFALSYQVTFLPKTYLEYILGTIFFTKNRLVFNIESVDTLYLYKYKDGTRYDIFDNLTAKTDELLYDFDKVELVRTMFDSNISFDPNTNQVTFLGTAIIGSTHTSWAIANENGELYIACNINENGFSMVQRHFRPGIETQVYSRYEQDVAVNAEATIDIVGIQSTDYVGELDVQTAYANIEIDGTNSTDFAETLPTQSATATIGIEATYPQMESGSLDNQQATASVSIDGTQSTDYVEDLSNQQATADVGVTGTQSTDYVESLPTQTASGDISVDGTKYEPQPVWNTTISTIYDGSVQLNTGTMNTTAVTTSLTSAYPPANYSFGFVMRCRIYSLDGSTFLGTTYRVRELEA